MSGHNNMYSFYFFDVFQTWLFAEGRNPGRLVCVSIATHLITFLIATHLIIFLVITKLIIFPIITHMFLYIHIYIYHIYKFFIHFWYIPYFPTRPEALLGPGPCWAHSRGFNCWALGVVGPMGWALLGPGPCWGHWFVGPCWGHSFVGPI